MSYEDRLETLGLTKLELRRKRGDLVQIYKIINGMEEVDIDMGNGHNLRRGGGDFPRRHGHQIEVKKTGINPIRKKIFTESNRHYLEFITHRGSDDRHKETSLSLE